MKNYLALFLFALFTTASFGQSNYQDVVYLKNGSIIRGIIIEQVPNKYIKIETTDRNIFVYQMDDIERLTKEPIQGRRTSTSKVKENYIGIVEVGYEIGTGDYGMDRLKLNIINISQINPYFSFGIGTGVRYYFDAEIALIPVFADFRAYFADDNVSPFLSLVVGYSFDATNRFENAGFLLSPTAGVSFMISDRSAMNVSIGYDMQKMKFDSGTRGETFTENSAAISINVGFTF